MTLAVGLMSGTSLDGIDAALVRFGGRPDDVTLAAFVMHPYDDDFRRRLSAAMAGGGPRELALLNVDLGGRLADAAAAVLDRAGVAPTELAFVASHGHTVWHEPGRATLQLGEPAVIAERLGVRVVSDFRPRDVAAGGEGAPLVPIADTLLFAAPKTGRVLLNVGGMANVTWVPRRGSADGVIAFDTGPGVAILDAVARRVLPGAAMDVGGRRSARGSRHDAVADAVLADAYFRRPPPKSTGRERFGDAVAERIIADVGEADDALATALHVTVRSVAEQCARWLPAAAAKAEVVLSGGGARNPALLDALRAALAPRPVHLFTDLFFDGDAKEAVAFALLGQLTLDGQPGNVPAATGAAGPRVLGRITPP